MSPAEDLQGSYRFCRGITRRAGSSFYLGFCLLPAAKRRAMEALYAFMRHTDDLADEPRPLDRRKEALRRWREAFTAGLAETAMGTAKPMAGEEKEAPRLDNDEEAELRTDCVPKPELGNESEDRCRMADAGSPPRPLTPSPSHPTTHDPVADSLLPALLDTVGRYGIPPEHLHAVVDGVEMDLVKRRYETFGELEEYCHRVASAVGLACLYIWGFSGPEALEPARKCGVALQLTNVLRDLREDVREDRVYLPLAELRQCDYSVEDLRRGVADGRFLRLMEVQTARAERFYREGAELRRWLEPGGRRIFGVMMASYRAILDSIRRRPEDVLTGRVSLSRSRKLAIFLRRGLRVRP